MSKFFKAFMIVALLSIFVAGCGGGFEENYMMTTVREATRTRILSPGFKFGFDTPNIIAAHGDVAMVREGNLIEFFTGHQLENNLAQVAGGKFTLGARKMFNPIIHFSVDFLFAGGDTIAIGESYEARVPTLLRPTEFTAEGFVEVNLERLSQSSTSLRDIFDSKFKVEQAKVTYEEIEKPNGMTSMEYVIELPRVKFYIADPSDDMVVILKALVKEKLFFSGGLSFGGRSELPSRSWRDGNGMGGGVKIEYVNYGGRVALIS